MSGKKFSAVIIPVMLSFFAMGFVDLVGTATNYMPTSAPRWCSSGS